MSRIADCLLGYRMLCRTLSCLLGAPSLEAPVQCGAGGIFLPNTPNSLVERGHPEKAKEVLRRVRGTTDVDTEFQSILVANKVMENMENPWRNIVRSAHSVICALFSSCRAAEPDAHAPQYACSSMGIPTAALLAGARISPS